MKYLRRFLFFITSRLFWVTLLSAIFIITFYLAMNASNIYIVITDGMRARAGVVLMQDDASELSKFFGRSFLETDETLRVGMSDASPYAHYDIRGFDHRIKMEWMWSWPWEDVARADIVESIPAIDGKVKSSRREAVIAAMGEGAVSPPPWSTGHYRVTLARTGGQWRITNLQLLETARP